MNTCLDLVVDVLAGIDIMETPASVMNSADPVIPVDEEKNFKDYWKDLEMNKFSSLWNEVPDSPSSVPSDEATLKDAKVPVVTTKQAELLNLPQTCWDSISMAEKLRGPRMKLIRARKEVTIGEVLMKSRFGAADDGWRRDRSESLSSGYESDSPSPSASLFSLMNLEVELPAFPIMPLSQLDNVVYQDKKQDASKLMPMFKERSRYSVVKPENRETLNLDMHLSPYLSIWETIAESRIPGYPSKTNIFMDGCDACSFGDVYLTLYSKHNRADNGCGQIDYSKMNLTECSQATEVPKNKAIWSYP
ncbi:uncharacterized protein LOC106646673 [Copidosoma floridanum]|uniref:uncharacterized protein LOC106646673 n=1 Tax=Copidosoma floridanum TaxID=29053 RepID=UPI0006C9A04A|nr:uncharacterized protein LOC106646673 [Copidosoma floridanum]